MRAGLTGDILTEISKFIKSSKPVARRLSIVDSAGSGGQGWPCSIDMRSAAMEVTSGLRAAAMELDLAGKADACP